MGENPSVGAVQEVASHDHVRLWQVCFVDQPLDLVFVTKISARQLLVVNESRLIPASSSPPSMSSPLATLRVISAALLPRDQELSSPFLAQANLGHCVHKNLEEPLLASTAHPMNPEIQLAVFASLMYQMQLEDCWIDQDLCDPAGQGALRGSCLKPCSGFFYIQCAFAHSHWGDGVALLI